MNWLRNHRFIRPFLSVVFLFALVATALAGTDYLRKSDYIGDGDTMNVDKPINSDRAVRYLGIDSPEMDGDTQEPWATASRDHLRSLLPSRTNVIIRTDVVETDVYGRNLAHVIRSADSLNANREQLRMGHAVTYVIYPNMLYFEDYRNAQIEAQQNGRGIWDPANPLTELPFEYRLRTNNRTPDKIVGDYFTKKYVDPADYALVHVNNRVFFFNGDAEAQSAGYTPCPKDSNGNYDSSCFASGN